MKLYLIASLFVTCYLCSACKNNGPKENAVKISSIPSTYINTIDQGFVFHQDTLYYKDEKFSGHVFDLYPNKDTAFTGGYINGLEEGMHKKWYPNKQLSEQRLYHNGKKVGKHLGYWEDGKPKFEMSFENREFQGIVREWYKTGQLYKFFHYEKGYEQGSQKMWWENGVIRANYEVRNGRRYGLVGLKLCMNPKDSINPKLK